MLKTILRPNMSKNYSIFGAGPSGLWTALRLSEGQSAASGSKSSLPKEGDVIDIYDPTRYAFSEALNPKYSKGDRVPGGRINTYYYGQKGQNGKWADYKKNTNAEMGGMRYLEYHEDPDKDGHRLVTHLINNYGLGGDPFDTTNKPLKYIDGIHHWCGKDTENGKVWTECYKNIFERHIKKFCLANGIESDADGKYHLSRNQRAKFYNEATYTFGENDPSKRVYEETTKLKNIGFWNLVLAEPEIGGIGYDYLLKTSGYNAFLINYNAASAMIRNNEFAPGSTRFRSIKGGFSILFDKMFRTIEENCIKNGIEFNYHSGYKLTSIHALKDEGLTKAGFTLGEHGNQWQSTGGSHTTDYAFLCMPRACLEQVASTTAGKDNNFRKHYVLNDNEVRIKIKSVISQPSFKIGAYFDEPWYEKIKKLDIIAHQQPGPTITDLPLRQTYYFGDNSLPGGEKKYAMLLSYDDMVNPYFWHQLRFTSDRRSTGHGDDLGSHGCQYIDVENNPAYLRILKNLIAELHDCSIEDIPDPCEAVVMDWSVEPFCGGYHAWEPHFDIVESQDKIRRPSGLLHKKEYRDYFQDAPIYIAGEAYSEDQGWVEGAFCTAESILADYLGVKPVKEGYYENYDLVLKKKE